MRFLLLPAILFIGATAARAGPPLTTDDARVMDGGKCHLEGMLQRQRGSKERRFELACNFTGHLELALGHERSRGGADEDARANLLQAKFLLREMQPSTPGFGIALGAARSRSPGEPGRSAPFLNLIGGLPLPGERAALQANLGATRDPRRHINRGTWGLASEYSLSPSFETVAETTGRQGEKPVLLVGMRVHAIPEILQISVALGNRRSEPAKGRFAAVGFHFEY